MSVETSVDVLAKLTGKRVLVVEDEPLVYMLIENGLLDAGASVVGPAGSVDEALRLIETTTYDGGLNAAVLDIKLHGIPVSPVADRLAALGVPFLFATGYGEHADRGMHTTAPILGKPFDLEALVTEVSALTAGK